VAFRLAGLAGRQGRASVMVTSGVRRTVEEQFAWGEGEEVELKGRSGKETVFPVIGREQAAGSTTLPGRNAAADSGGSPGSTAEMPVQNAD
jgi:class 3 adenylate cyclase